MTTQNEFMNTNSHPLTLADSLEITAQLARVDRLMDQDAYYDPVIIDLAFSSKEIAITFPRINFNG